MNRPASVAEFALRRYMLEPGDGTHYEFSLFECYGHNGTIRGVGNGSGYVGLILHGPGSGAYELRIDSVRNPQWHYVDYLSQYFKAAPYTLTAILLAIGVLVDQPDNVEAAMDAMLKTPELLKD